MRWNAVRNSKKPRAALIKSKKRSEEKEKEKKLMRERGREKRRERTREKWNKETIRLGDSIAAVVSRQRGEREREREREKERTEREVFINWKANWPRSE